MKSLFLFCFLLFACLAQVKSYVFKEDEYNASLKAWRDLKSKAYTYVIVDPRYGNSENVARTTIKVRNGRVVSRQYLEEASVMHYPNLVVDYWSETTPEAIGSHEKGYPARTLDDVYAHCLNEILTQDQEPTDAGSVNRPEYFGRVEVDANGLLSLCGFYTDYGLFGSVLNVESVRYC